MFLASSFAEFADLISFLPVPKLKLLSSRNLKQFILSDLLNGNVAYCFADPVEKITLAVSNLQKSISYWQGLLKMKPLKQSDKSAELIYGEGQTVLELFDIGIGIEIQKILDLMTELQIASNQINFYTFHFDHYRNCS